MSLSIRSLASLLGDACSQYSITLNDSCSGADCALMLKDQKNEYKAGNVYIGTVKKFIRCGEYSAEVTYYLQGDMEQISDHEKYNIITFPETITISEAFNRVTDIIFNYYNWEYEMDRLSQSETGLKDMLNKTEDLIDMPLALMDLSLYPLLLSDGIAKENILWQSYHNDVDISEYYYRNNPDNGSQLSILESTNTISSYKLVNVMSNNYIVGYLLLEHSKDIDSQYINGLLEIVEHLAVFVQHVFDCTSYLQTVVQKKSSDYLLRILIEPQTHNTEEIIQLIKDSIPGIPRKFRVCSVFSDTNAFLSNMRLIKNTIEKLFRWNLMTLYKGALVCLIDAPTSVYSSKHVLDSVNAKCGLSNIFEDIRETSSYYEQSIMAYKQGRRIAPDKTLYPYNEYMNWHCVQLIKEKLDAEDLVRPEIKKLRLYDKETGRDYCKTLSAFLLFGRNITKAAKHLHIHRNTMIYRMEQINQMIGFEFVKPREVSSYMYSLQVSEYIESDP